MSLVSFRGENKTANKNEDWKDHWREAYVAQLCRLALAINQCV